MMDMQVGPEHFTFEFFGKFRIISINSMFPQGRICYAGNLR